MVNLQLHATAEMAAQFHDLFVNRRAYTLQSMRPHPETGRHYYFQPQRGRRLPFLRWGWRHYGDTWLANSRSGCIRSIRKHSGQSGLPSTPTIKTPSNTC